MYFENLWVLACYHWAFSVKITEHPIEVRNLPIVPIDKESNLIELIVRLT